jgi:alpha-L-rhamnosidase
MARVGPDFIYNLPPPVEEEGGQWVFIDWQETLDKAASIHAVVVFALRSLSELAVLLGIPSPTLHPPYASAPLTLDELVKEMTAAARSAFFDSERGVFLSGKARQLSWASNAWSILAGIPSSQAEAAAALRAAYVDPASIGGATPYMHHYLCEAFIVAGLPDLALRHIEEYWGSMIAAGGETFFECWDPARPRSSPYSDLHANSFAHAWSCTPSLLLRQLGFE